MNQNESGIENPEGYGIQDAEAPGEPDYWSHDVSNPVPGIHKETRDEQQGLRSGHHEQTEGQGHTSSRGGRGGHRGNN
ncbi:MAG TPA: hypothetical protein VKX16_15835 [Chloroflexota bacterium]|nr:hypothetical protein [Chloroflexota bacterium]